MSTTKSIDLELIIWYYVRNEYENKFNKRNIPMPLKYLIVSFSKHIFGSKLLTFKEDIEFVELLLTKIGNIKRFNLLFRASENGFKSKEFHNKCDNNGSTITIIKSNFGNIFGGYASIPWTSPSMYKWCNDPNTFLFLIRSNNETNQNNCPLIFEIKDGQSHQNVFHDSNDGPSFGRGQDLLIQDNCNYQATADRLETNFVCPKSYDYGILEGPLCGGNLKDFDYMDLEGPLCGDVFCFQVLEYEVFQIE